MTTQTTEYFLTYAVLADSRLEALMKAGAMLRQTVRIVGEAEAEQGLPGWWDVTFLVAEDYDPPLPTPTDWLTKASAVLGVPVVDVAEDYADHPADATFDLPEGADPITQAKAGADTWTQAKSDGVVLSPDREPDDAWWQR